MTSAQLAGGVVILGESKMPALLSELPQTICKNACDGGIRYRLAENELKRLAPDFDTLGMAQFLGLQTVTHDVDLVREIVLCLLASPVEFVFPSETEFIAHIEIRKFIVYAARRTQLEFKTSAAERPLEFWTYHPDTSFTIRSGKSLIDGLRAATQPSNGAQQYSFSCYRASEYVILLGIALVLERFNPQLLRQLEQQWQTQAIMSGKFHEIFCANMVRWRRRCRQSFMCRVIVCGLETPTIIHPMFPGMKVLG